MPQATYNLANLYNQNLLRVNELQEAVRPLAMNFLRLAADQNLPVKIVSAYRPPSDQQALYDSGKNVTNAPALMSYHNHRLAFDAVPLDYLSFPDWNPSGPLWNKIGAIGQSVGLEWGGTWKKKDLPHFQLSAAPIQELKAYFTKFGEIMPIKIEPTTAGAVVAVLVVGFALWFYREYL